MQLQKEEKYLLITCNEGSFTSFFEAFSKLNEIDKEHLIVDLTICKAIVQQDFLSFLAIAQRKKENGTSFAVIYKDVDADAYPEELNVVPTLTEAKDILEMEAIERELGF